MNLFIGLLALGAFAEYFTCDSLGHACLVGQSCCARSGGEYGCCPFENSVCCADSEGHCCPSGFPICDIAHKKCTNHLQYSHDLGLKSKTLNVLNATEFIVGLASGLGLRLDEYILCAQQSSITVSLTTEFFKYTQGTTEFDKLMALEILGEIFQHISLIGSECGAAYKSTIKYINNLGPKNANENSLLWVLFGNFMKKGNYVYRDLSMIHGSDWRGTGYHIGKIISNMISLS